jgi:hypothetical protein
MAGRYLVMPASALAQVIIIEENELFSRNPLKEVFKADEVTHPPKPYHKSGANSKVEMRVQAWAQHPGFAAVRPQAPAVGSPESCAVRADYNLFSSLSPVPLPPGVNQAALCRRNEIKNVGRQGGIKAVKQEFSHIW